MISADGLVKVFSSGSKEVVAVDRISLTVNPGEVVGILGVNGAGKTTLLRMLSTVLTPTEGAASIAGFGTVTEAEDVRKNIGFLSGSTGLYGRLSGREMLEYFGGLFEIEKQELKKRIDRAIDRFGIGPFADQLCDQMSTGQKQRVSIARSILHDPPVLMFDEPTSGLDVLTAQTVMEFIEEQKAEGKTILYSTHIMSEAQRLCSRISVIHDGRIEGEGTLDQILEQTGETLLEKAFLKLIKFESGAAV